MQAADRLTEKIQALSKPQIAEVERFIEAMQGNVRDGELARSAAALSAASFAAIWNNPEDDVYDAV